MSVELKDFSIEVKAEINETTIKWLYDWADEIASTAKDTCAMTDDKGQLRKSYRAEVDDGAGKAQIGSQLESALWEEFGTGEHAVREPHRRGWWVYIEGGSGYEGETNHYMTKKDAERAAAFLRNVKKLDAKVTNGRDPNYTLEKAFKANANKAKADLKRRLKEMGD